MATKSLLEHYLDGKDYDNWLRKCLGVEEDEWDGFNTGLAKLAAIQVPTHLREKYPVPVKIALLTNPKASNKEEIAGDLEFLIDTTKQTFSLLGYQVERTPEEDQTHYNDSIKSKSFSVKGEDVSLRGEISVKYDLQSPKKVLRYQVSFYKV